MNETDGLDKIRAIWPFLLVSVLGVNVANLVWDLATGKWWLTPVPLVACGMVGWSWRRMRAWPAKWPPIGPAQGEEGPTRPGVT